METTVLAGVVPAAGEAVTREDLRATDFLATDFLCWVVGFVTVAFRTGPAGLAGALRVAAESPHRASPAAVAAWAAQAAPVASTAVVANEAAIRRGGWRWWTWLLLAPDRSGLGIFPAGLSSRVVETRLS
ncbi:hypothetical protein [Luteococcus japonicus]|uniref:hypothetical protein n=1 Tax=Luteococcus japonicus TaxID=33984 RepID=UPI001180C6A2|nr:hypothetical protein [Luteococcus japonicus]